MKNLHFIENIFRVSTVLYINFCHQKRVRPCFLVDVNFQFSTLLVGIFINLGPRILLGFINNLNLSVQKLFGIRFDVDFLLNPFRLGHD